MSKHRLFIALPISATLKKKISAWKQNYTKLPVRWIKGKNLHLTLIPPWYEEDYGRIKKLLDQFLKINKTNSLRLKFESISYGPTQSSPRLIWASIKPSIELSSFRNELEKFLISKEIPIKKEKRLFKPHLTLARFNSKDFLKFPIKKISDKVYWEIKISKYILMESHLSRSGADYELIHPLHFRSLSF